MAEPVEDLGDRAMDRHETLKLPRRRQSFPDPLASSVQLPDFSVRLFSLLSRRGYRPSAPHDQRKLSAYIFGTICPRPGKAAAPVTPWCDTRGMNQYLIEISRHVAENAHAALITDWWVGLGANLIVVEDRCHAWQKLQSQP